MPLRIVGGAILLVALFLIAAVIGGGGAKEGSGRLGGPGGSATLGPPTFSTKNTSRVAGGDPAANAAGVALAVFPPDQTRGRERLPRSVALVPESSPAAAIAASVLMAPPVRAPILLSSGNALPAVSAEALSAFGDPETIRIGGGASPAKAASGVARLRERLFKSPPAHFVIAPAEKLAFAMPAAAWAARSGDPVLFAGRKKLPGATAAVLRRHPKTPAFVLGPKSAISDAVLRRIAAIDHRRVRRVAGKDPVSNAIALARYRDGDFGWDVNDPGHGFVVARSDSPLDAAAAAPLSASGTWGPLLLTDDADTLPAALHGYLLDVKPGYTTNPTRAFYNHVWLIGDEGAIGVGEQAEIDSLAELAKIGGKQP
jgi:hypothetical protein